MISALAWVSRAAVKDVPIYGEPTPEELDEMKQADSQGDLGTIAAVPRHSYTNDVGHLRSRNQRSFMSVTGANEGPEDEHEEDEDWTTDDEGMEEAEQISKAKSMAAVIKSSKGTFILPAPCTFASTLPGSPASFNKPGQVRLKAGCACSGKAEQGGSASKAGFSSSDAAMAELDMEHYDSDGAETSGQVRSCSSVPIAFFLVHDAVSKQQGLRCLDREPEIRSMCCF